MFIMFISHIPYFVGGFHQCGYPPNGWLIMENTVNTMKMDDLGVPLFQETSKSSMNVFTPQWRGPPSPPGPTSPRVVTAANAPSVACSAVTSCSRCCTSMLSTSLSYSQATPQVTTWELMDWFKGRFTGNHGFLPSNIGVSCKFFHYPIL